MTFGQLIRAALALIAAFVLVPVIEAGKVVWKLTRAALGASPTADALAEQDAVLAQDAPAASAEPISPDAYGRAALAFLATGDAPDSSCLDDDTRDYLLALTDAEVDELGLHTAFGIGRHLLGHQPITALPKPQTPLERLNANSARLAATAELQATVAASQRQREQDAVTQAILDYACDDTPSWLPRGA